MNLKKYWYWILLALIFVIFIFFGRLIELYTDWLWFVAIGYSQVFLTILRTKILLAAGLGVLFFVIIFINVLIAKRLAPKAMWVMGEDIIEIPGIEGYKRIINRFLIGAIALFSLLLATGFTTIWNIFLRFVHATPFNISDPIFGKDISFYVFKLPFIKFMYSFGTFALFMSAIVVLIYYFLSGSIKIGKRGIGFTKGSEVHLSILGALIFGLIAYGYRMGMYDLLYSARGIIFGAGYTDINATLPVLWILLILTLVTSVAFLVNTYIKGWRLPIISIIVLIVVSLLGKSIYPGIVQRLYVAPNEIAKETPYIDLNIKYTRAAYNLDKVKEKEFSVDESLTLGDIRRNDATISNIRLWDHRPLLATYGQLQEIRTYYDFVDVDVDRYKIGREYRQVMLSPRELSYAALPSKIWINEHLTYTHGYGLALSPVNKLTLEGLPELLIKDIPPVSPKDLRIERPEIYYGEIANDYCFVNTKSKEFDYPAGEKNVYTHYAGEGGVSNLNLFRKAAYAIKFGSSKIFLSGDIKKDSRIMYYRRVTERITKVAPFINYDNDPYMTIADGKLYWILDGYTLSDMYPYSDPSGRLGNYIRNSVKVVLDVYNGSIFYYISDPNDPIIQTYSKAFPHMFKSIDEMPEEIRSHIRYPEVMFSVQVQKFATYHMTDAQVFYNKEDLWNIAKETFERDVRDVEPYYTIMKLPGEKSAEFILMIPFTPAKKDNMSAWMCARADEPHYGELILYRFPKKKLIYGPMQIEARIDQDPDISRELSLWSQRGSQVIRGNLLVIPIEKSLLYVEPLYLKAERGQLPELKRVIVVFGNRIAMEENLESSLNSIFGGRIIRRRREEIFAPVGVNIDELVKEANEHLKKAKKYQREGNWSLYGEEMQKLEEVLKKLGELRK